MVNLSYYDGTKLLSMKDLNGDTPEIFLCTTNRTGGKTTYFSRLLVNKFKNKKGKFMLLYRFNYNLGDCDTKFFKDIKELFFPSDTLRAETRANGLFKELYLNDESCGYAVSLNSAEQIKNYSHMFNDVERIFFDEFQSETNHYCSGEVKKFISIHVSVSRGQAKQKRYVPVYMTGNPVTIINPYYVELGISDRIRSNTNFLKGDGFVLEQGFNESASKAQKESGFNKAFKNNAYVAYSSESVYLNDSYAFIGKPNGNGRYICTIKYENQEYGVREYADKGILYIDDRADSTFRLKITVTTDDHNINYVMLKRNDVFLQQLRFYFEKGCFRFKTLSCKSALLKCLSY